MRCSGAIAALALCHLSLAAPFEVINASPLAAVAAVPEPSSEVCTLSLVERSQTCF